jgi:hypothetical protein
MKIIRHETESYYLEEHVISDQRRPPIITLSEYRAKRGITDWNEAEFYHPEQSSQANALA